MSRGNTGGQVLSNPEPYWASIIAIVREKEPSSDLCKLGCYVIWKAAEEGKNLTEICFWMV